MEHAAALSDVPVEATSLTKDAWKRLKKHKMAMAGLIIVLVYVVVSVLAFLNLLPIHSYDFQVPVHQNLPPSLRPAGEVWYETEEAYLYKAAKADGRTELNSEEKAKLEEIKRRIETEVIEYKGKNINPHKRVYILGTDYLGRDMLARIIYGGQVSIAIGLVGTLVSVFIGIIVGAIAGYAGGKIDYILMRVVDVMYGLPYMLIVIILMALFGNNLINLFIALALVSWLTVARVVRGQIISLKNSEFIEAARSMGASPVRIIARHLVPNTLGVIIVFSSLRIPSFIMMEAFLSFLGLGISAPLASWGSLIRDGVEGMTLYPWRLIFPALAMTLFLFAMNFLGDGLRDAFDPHSKNSL
ncbi:ABC transporter permease [Spirochaetia bacterium 38H-sp]|uniref:Oligopeptide transport system permease protein OppC n=1 Tax=Rarispira pelagica TaxID=3141764 RepID=A0ABU9UAS6_9SPIR